MNFLFWIICTLLAVGVAIQWGMRRRHQTSGGTPFLDRDLAFTRRSQWPLAPDQWSLSDIAIMAGADRSRAVIQIQIRDAPAAHRQRALRQLAREVYRLTEVQAVLVENSGASQQAPELYLFAADGRGWWGHEILSTALKGPDF